MIVLPLMIACGAIFHQLMPDHFASTELADTIVWNIRLPRALFGIVAGASLAVGGCILQGILKNTLASDYTLGIAQGAGFGAALAIIFGSGLIKGEYLIVGNAFLFSLLPTFFIFGMSRYKRATPETLILAGIAMMSLFGAAIILVQFFGSSDAVTAVVFWMFGDLGKATWDKLIPMSLMMIFCMPYLISKSFELNVMGAGDESAKSLGVNVERSRVIMMLITSLMISSVVCFTGAIGFVGLVGPHIARMIIGGDNRFLIPAAGLFGAILLVGSDMVATQVISPTILPVGVVTSFMGVPLFIYLIMKSKLD
ncbi:FecCD family ABC transporter permease [Methanothrix sp.]|uniref:FecCD family ABC transporter permease n=2 Tax=Methanothrix sp. TaxID=90426 RepID=UPI003BB61E10